VTDTITVGIGVPSVVARNPAVEDTVAAAGRPPPSAAATGRPLPAFMVVFP
jgi:hypothetical protein